MSVIWTEYVWQHGPKDPHVKFVLLRLADRAGKEGTCFPSIGSIAIETCLSESTVRRAVQELEKGGWLTVIRGNGRGKSSHYQLLERVSCGQALGEEERVSGENPSEEDPLEERVSPGQEKGVTQTEKGVTLQKPPHPLISINRQEPSLNRNNPADLSLACQCVCASTGIFGMREQRDMFECFKTFVLSNGHTIDEAQAHMVQRWEEYQSRAPSLAWSFGSAHKFFMSGQWDKPDMWPLKPKTRQQAISEWRASPDEAD